MTTTLFSHQTLATVTATILGLSLLPFGTSSAAAATVTKTVPSSCRTNGAPLGRDITRTKQDSLTITTPTTVKAHDEFTVTLRYMPEMVPGKENIATMKQLRNIVLRFTIDDPHSFVTARLADNGKNIFGSPQIALVGGNRLVLSGMNVNVNGHDTRWAPPTVTLTLRATTAGTVPTIHPAVEGAAGQFNNPANFMTMNTITDSTLGTLNLQLNCQATSPAATYASVPVKKTAADTAHTKKTTTARKVTARQHRRLTGGHNSVQTAPSASLNSHSLASDDDIYATSSDTSGLPTWVNAMLALVCVGATGGIGYRYYTGKNHKND